MNIFKKKKPILNKTPKPEINIYNIVKPIKLKKNEKLIFVVGDEDNIPPEEVFHKLSKSVDDIKNGGDIIMPAVIKVYIVSDDCKIELYRGDKLEDD